MGYLWSLLPTLPYSDLLYILLAYWSSSLSFLSVVVVHDDISILLYRSLWSFSLIVPYPSSASSSSSSILIHFPIIYSPSTYPLLSSILAPRTFPIFSDHGSYPYLLIFSCSIIIARSSYFAIVSIFCPSSSVLHIITYRSSSIGLHETSSNVWDLSVDPEYLWAIETISMSPLHIQPLKSLRLWH